MKNRTGIYICSGCDIGKSINIEKLIHIADNEYNARVCKSHSSYCSVEGYDQINRDIENEELGSVVIAACSPRVKTAVFDFPENVLCERVNLREQVAWCFEREAEDTQFVAEDYLRMGISRVNNISAARPYIEENIYSDILVVGGGITGINASLEGAKAGYNIHLIEKEENLGGWSDKLYKQYPEEEPFSNLIDPVIKEKIKAIEENTSIQVYKPATIKKISGQPGKFDVIIQNGKEQKINVGAIIASMGWKPYNANNLTNLGFGKYNNVLTNVEFEELINNDPERSLPKSIVFIQCAGSRDKDHLPYCSTFCCSTTLKHTRYINEISPETLVYIIYKDVRTPGLSENFYEVVQKNDRVFMTKGDIKNVFEQKNILGVTVENTLIGEEIKINAEMVVLATGMTPAGTEDLNLEYRLGKGLPELKYNFPDSHFICFPYETRRTGIYAAGTLRAPMDIPSSIEDSKGAMLKAIQCIESTKRGEAVHPRSGDRSYPDLYLDRCTDCKRCTEECAFGAYDETEKGTPLSNPNRCRRCGVCLGACPERVISFSDFSVNSISSVIKSVDIPDGSENKPRILVFVCENDAYPALDMAGVKGIKYSPFVRVVPVRCIGSINKVWISDALSQGFDGILQIGCKPGDDYQCHFIHGSELTETRGENYRETLDTMKLSPERIKTEFVEINDHLKITEIINEYVETVKRLPPTPFK